MTYTTAIINLETIKARCDVNESGCWVWTMRKIKGAPYWSTYNDKGERVAVHVGRAAAEESGIHVPPKKKFVRTCGNSSCVNPEHFHFPKSMGVFSQLLKPSERTNFW